MKKIGLIVLVLLAGLPLMGQQRQRGYQGSVTVMMSYLPGIETSHGYQFNEHHYLGAGLGAIPLFPKDDFTVFAYPFLDYQAYWFSRRNTPFCGVKTGLVTEGFNYSGMLFLEPSIGWSWDFTRGGGLNLSLGCIILVDGVRAGKPASSWKFNPSMLWGPEGWPYPKLSLTYNFK